MPHCIHLFPRIQSHLGSPYSPTDHRSGHELESLQLKKTGGQYRQSSIPGFEKEPPNATKKIATLSTIGFEGNGADDVEELLASHGQPFTNHALQQQLGRLSINVC
jgi:hypothetical protein